MKRAYSIAVALSISLFIYLFFRPERTVVNELAVLILSLPVYSAIKTSIAHAMPLNELIIYSLPGGLWIFSATALSQDFYLRISDHRVQVALIPILFAIGLEFCQLLHLTNGRFDAWDIVFYVLFWLLAHYSFQSHESRQNTWSPFTLHGFICLACFLSVYLAHVNP